MMIIFLKVNGFIVKKYENGTTKDFKKTPLILKYFFRLKFVFNDESMAQGNKSHEDGLGSIVTIQLHSYANFNCQT